MENTQVSFTDTSKECIQMMRKLSRAALRDGFKVVLPIVRDKMPVKRGFLKKSVNASVYFDKVTGQPYAEIGYWNRKKMRKKFGINMYTNASWIEFGTKPHSIQTKQSKFSKFLFYNYKLHDNNTEYGYFVEHPGMTSKNFLRNTVYENADKIEEAMQKKLKELEEYVLSEGMTIDIGGDEEIE